MVIISSFDDKGIVEVFNQAMRLVRWSEGLNDDIKRVLILSVINEVYCTRRFYCYEMYNISRNQKKFNQFGSELDNNFSLDENKYRIRELFNKYFCSCDTNESTLPPIPPRLRRSVVLSVCRDTDGNYRLYHNGKAGAYNVTVPVTSFEDLSCDF